MAVISSPCISPPDQIRCCPNNGSTDTCCTPCKCSPVSLWPGPQGLGKNNVTRLLAPVPETPALCWQWLLIADPGRHLRGHALTGLHPLMSVAQESSVEGEGESWDPSQQWPFCRQTLFLFFLFFSHCQIQFCTQFTSSFFSPPLFFRQRQKSSGQRRPSFRLNHSDTEWIVVFVCFSSFQLEPGSQVSHTEHVWERREPN